MSVRKIRGVLANTVVRSPLWTPSTRARLLKMVGVEIGSDVRFYPFSTFINYVDQVSIGDDVFINAGVVFGSNAPISIGSGVSIGPGCSLLPTSHALGPSTRRAGKAEARPIVIGEGAWLGANVTILGGVEIGPGAVVAAGAVVTDSVPADVIAAGVPARVVRKLDTSNEFASG